MDKFVKFDQSGYTKAIKSAITDELNYIEPHIINALRNSFGTVALRRVDAKYQSAMMNSIQGTVHERANSFVASIGAGGEVGKQNQGFRAVYYEYGTGNQMQPPNHWTEGQAGGAGGWNMARKGRDIYQRPRGTWTDLGGNEHRSKIKGEPKLLANKPGSFGEEITASHWFQKAMTKTLSLFDDAVRRAVKSVPISTYIGIRSITKRM